MQDMTPTGMAMVRRCMCVKDFVNSLVDAVLFTARTYRVAQALTDCENKYAVLTESKCYPVRKSWTVVAAFSVVCDATLWLQVPKVPAGTGKLLVCCMTRGLAGTFALYPVSIFLKL